MALTGDFKHKAGSKGNTLAANYHAAWKIERKANADLNRRVLYLEERLLVVGRQRDEMALELEKLREHAYEKFSNKRKREV